MKTQSGTGISTFPSATNFSPDQDISEAGKVFTNEIDPAHVTGGEIGVSHIVEVGLQVSMRTNSHVTISAKLPTMAMHSETQAVFLIDNSTVFGKTCLDIYLGKEQTSKWSNGSAVGWADKGEHTLANYLNRVGSPTCFDNTGSTKRDKRAGCTGGSGGACGPFGLFPAINYLAGQGAQTSDAIFNAIKQSDMLASAAKVLEDSRGTAKIKMTMQPNAVAVWIWISSTAPTMLTRTQTGMAAISWPPSLVFQFPSASNSSIPTPRSLPTTSSISKLPTSSRKNLEHITCWMIVPLARRRVALGQVSRL